MRRNLRNKSGERGNAMLEGALVLWPFLMILFGIIQFAFVIWSQNTLSFAVNEGVRFASLHGAASDVPATNADITAVIRANAIGLTPTNIAVTTTWNPNNRPGSFVNVTAVYPMETIVSVVWKQRFDLRATTQMLILN